MKRKLLFAMLCIVSALGLRAQMWTSAEVAAGEFYLYNVGRAEFFTKGNGWGTQASVTTSGIPTDGIKVTLSDVDGKWFICTGVSNAAYGLEHLSGGTCYTDQSRNKKSTWTFTQVGTDNGPVYNIVSADNHGGGANAVLTALDGTVVGPGNDGTKDDAKWKLLDARMLTLPVRYGEIKAAALAVIPALDTTKPDEALDGSKTVADLQGAIASLRAAFITALPGESIPADPGYIDVTAVLIDNAGVHTNTDYWTIANLSEKGGSAGVCNFGECEFYNRNFKFYQTLTLDKGTWEFGVTGFHRAGNHSTYFYAGEDKILIPGVSGSVVNNMAGAKDYFDAGNGKVALKFGLEDGDEKTIEIGIENKDTETDKWTIFRDFTLKYFGPAVDYTTYKNRWDEAVAAANEAKTNNPKITFGEELEALNAAISNAPDAESKKADYTRKINELNEAVKNFIKNSGTYNEAFDRYDKVKAGALAIDGTIDTGDADAEFNAATSLEEVSAAVANLRQKFVEALPSVSVPADPGYIDVTDVMVDNASVAKNANFWTAEEVGAERNNSFSWAVCNYDECEFYQQNFKFYQTLKLGTGTWEFGVTGFHRAGNHNTYFYAGEDKILIPGVESSVVNTMSQAKTYFDGGNGQVALKFGLEPEEDGIIEIGIENKDTETDKWTIFRNFTLKYYGSDVDYTAYQARWDEAKTTAENVMAEYDKVTMGNEYNALQDALADAPATGDKKADYNSKINTLTAATNTFKANAAGYLAYANYLQETLDLFSDNFGLAEPTTAEEATDAMHALNVGQYKFVADNYEYSLNGLIGDFGTWEKTATSAGEEDAPQFLNYEHWSGVSHAYYEQGKNGWNSNAWTVKYEKKCKLPAGDYVLKVAARSSAGVTSKMSCSATSKYIALPNYGNSARGINVKGEASWSDEDTFATPGGKQNAPKEATEGGTGAGWQWRFLPFSLNKRTEVTMTFEAEASSQYQWMSIADGELLSLYDIADEVEYADNEENTIENVAIANVTLKREIKKGYNTVVVPFNLGVNDVTKVFGEGSEVYNYSENSEDAEKVTVNFKKGDGSINANVPVLVKATTASSAPVFKGVQVVAPAEELKVEGKNIDFVGSYAPMAVAAGDYFLNEGKIFKSEGKTNMAAFRAYLKTKTAGVKAELFIDGVATSIEAINGTEKPQGAIYNLNGQRVQKAQKGLYIIGGKKVLVK